MLGYITKWFLCAVLIGLSYTKPVIIQQPESQNVLQGGELILKCVVEGIPQEDQNPVQWSRGGFALGHDLSQGSLSRYAIVGDVSRGEYNLHIANASVSKDDTHFECQVTNYELRSESAVVAVLVPPAGPYIDDAKNDEPMATLDVVVGVENKMTCRGLNGKPAAGVQWYRNEELISDVQLDDSTISSSKLQNSSATLLITPTHDDNGAIYVCEMTSTALEAPRRKLIRLKLLEPPIVSVYLPPSIYENRNVAAECRSHSVPPVQSYNWFLNDVELKSEKASTISLGPVNSTWHDVKVGCEASNSAGKSERSETRMDVLYAPVLTSSTDKMEADIGQNVTLSCLWDSNPRPEVTWNRKGSDVVIASGQKLHLIRVTQSDSGMYNCRAYAEESGSNNTSVQLLVNGPPIFNHPTTQYAFLGGDAVITCSLSSHPGIRDVTWSWKDKNSAPVSLHGNGTYPTSGSEVKFHATFEPTSSVARLQIVKTTDDDLRTYTCNVDNSYGVKSAGINLKEEHPAPIFTVGVSVAVAVGAFLLFLALMLVVYCCLRSKRQQKSTNFDKMKKSSRNRTNQYTVNTYRQDETVAVNHENSGMYNLRTSVSSQGAPASTSSEQGEPLPPLVPDDGYHTEEATSWNRTDQQVDKTDVDATDMYPQKAPEMFRADYVDLPPIIEGAVRQPLLSSPYPASEQFPNYPPPPMSANNQPYDPMVIHTPVTAMRSASVLDGRFSPSLSYMQRQHSEVDAPSSGMYVLPPANYYPTVSTYNPSQSATMYAGDLPYSARHRVTPVPAAMAGFDRGLQPFASSQSSLDRFERGSALSASVMPPRPMEQYDPHQGRNLHSRLSQSSKSSEFNRPLVARMATHV